MRITVKIYASLRKHTDGEGTIELELQKNSEVEDILEMLRIPDDEVKIIMINGKRSQTNMVLRDGDRVAIFPPIAGG